VIHVLAGKARRLHSILFRFAGLFLLFAVCVLPAHAHTYEGLDVEVPFKFKIGDRAFRPGRYQFVMVGNGVVALRDAKRRVIASLVARPIQTGAPVTQNKLVFRTKKKDKLLSQIWIENRAQVLDVLGEQMAMQPAHTVPVPRVRPEIDSLFERNTVPRFKY
jgi:hypothetical protein